MKRASLIAAALLLIAPPLAHAWVAQKGGTVIVTSTTQVLAGKGITQTSNAGTRFYPIAWAQSPAGSPTNTTLFPVAGAVTKIKMFMDVPPTGGQTWTGTLYKNGSATALTCVVNSSSSPAGVCTGTGSVSFAAGDFADYAVASSGSPALSDVSASFVFAPTNANDTMIPTIGLSFSPSVTYAAYPFNGSLSSFPGGRRNSPIPGSGTVDTLRVLVDTAPGTAASGKAYNFSFGSAGTGSAVICNILETATGCIDNAHSFSLTGPSGGVAGDDVQFVGFPINTPASPSADLAVRFRPTTSGSFALMSVGSGSAFDSATGTTYSPIVGGFNSLNTTEAPVQIAMPAMTVTTLAVITDAPGAGGSGVKRTFTLRKNGVNTALTCDIIETATSCSTTGSISVAENDLLSTADTATGTATTAVPGISYLAHQ